MGSTDRICSSIPDLQLQMMLFMEPEQLKESGLLASHFNDPQLRFNYFQARYNIPRQTGAKEYCMKYHQMVPILQMMKENNKLEPSHQEIPTEEDLSDPDVSQFPPLYGDLSSFQTLVMHNQLKLAKLDRFDRIFIRPAATTTRYIYEFIMRHFVEKCLSIEAFDPPRFGDYLAIVLDDGHLQCGLCLFCLNPLFSFEFGIPMLDDTYALPKEIIVGDRYPIDYYDQLNNYVCLLDITKIRKTIIDNLIQMKYTVAKHSGGMHFNFYLSGPVEKNYQYRKVDSINDADSSSIIVPGAQIVGSQDQYRELNVRIGLNSMGWNQDIGDFKPPSESFIEMIQKHDMVSCCIRNTYNNNYTIQLMDPSTVDFYYSRTHMLDEDDDD
jgi:hypothetical protein